MRWCGYFDQSNTMNSQPQIRLLVHASERFAEPLGQGRRPACFGAGIGSLQRFQSGLNWLRGSW